jgi:nucleotide-binding universal stress UspA family protein
MKILVGVIPDSSAADAMALAALLQKSMGAEVVLGHVYAAPSDQGGKRKVDAEWVDYLRSEAADIVADAAGDAPRLGLTEFTTSVHGHRSSGVGLDELAHKLGATMVVIGSAPGSAKGRFLIGSTADQLLHGAHVPVALAPAEYRRSSPESLARVVVAFQDTPESHKALEWASENARDLPITGLTVIVRHRVMGSNQAFDGESLVAQQVRDAQAEARISFGDTVQSAVQRFDWTGDELLVLASGGSLLRRVFLGDMTYKLLRAAPVPAIVLPRHT